MLVEMILLVIIEILLFLVGLFYLRWHINLNRWDKPFFSALIISITWLIINIVLGFIFSSLIGDLSLIIIVNPVTGFRILLSISDLLIMCIDFFVGFIILISIYKAKWLRSLTIVGLAQISLFVTSFIINSLLIVIGIFLIQLPIVQRLLDGAKITFILLLLVYLLATWFGASWGDKIQLVKLRRVVVIVSVIPGFLYLIPAFISQNILFFDFFVQNFLISFTLSITTILIAKKIAYRTIPIQELRDLQILEKGKPLLKVTNLKVYYPLLKGVLKRKVGEVKAVTGVSFEIKTGETLGLVGESGCGKTTIANTILGLINKEDGEILFRDEPLPNEFTSYYRQKIQLVFQDPDASLNPRLKVIDIIAEPLKNLLGITDKRKIRRHVLKLLEQVSLKREHLDRYPHEFSGGQKQRIIIARALACNPELVVLDEPTSALDVSVQAQILNLLIDLQEEYGYGFLFITHNLAVVNHIADRVAVMYLGKFVEVGQTDQIFNNPTHPYTQALLESRSEIDPFDQDIKYVIEGEVPSPIAPPPGCTFNPRCVSDARTPECEFETPHQIKIDEGHYIWCVNPPVLQNNKVQNNQSKS
jgi:oligopeptide/dipeptide ABC transporter ATP-binding protein